MRSAITRKIGTPVTIRQPQVPQEIRKGMELWVGCVAGALSDTEYQHKLANAGFESIDIEATRVYKIEDAQEFLRAGGIDAESIAPKVQTSSSAHSCGRKRQSKPQGVVDPLAAKPNFESFSENDKNSRRLLET